ncbi:alpha-(1,3)-fucosyltransferase C [Cherax quadricarinatus]|uniref:alpha-(1,3)-fucosyltransferase C n=1 Tax=Cherax quadricarinatus TaxID=27406 RepID=UPI00387E75B2
MNRKYKLVVVLGVVTVVICLMYADLMPSFPLPNISINYGNILRPTENRTKDENTTQKQINETYYKDTDPPHLHYPSLLPPGEGDRDLGSNPTTEVTITPILLPGDSNFPYEELSMVNASSPPVDLFKEVSINADDPPLKKILFWNDAYSNKHFGFGFGREPFLRAGCRVNTCMTTGDRSKFPLMEIDAVIWHFRAKDKSLPKLRSPHTRYVFWMMESASHLYGNIEPYNNVFNWTMTYRLDSDFPNPYSYVYRRRTPLEPTNRNYSAGKSKFAAWFVSNCNTIGGRDKLVTTLRKWIEVDQYGHCSSLKCERKDEKKCYAMLASDYKFYFSFENSLCRDYVTEKLFNILRLDVIPVVYGSANYSQHAPPHSYIDALSFPTAKALADYLIYLNNNDTAYNEYFRWKRFHRLPGWSKVARSYCDMCERLHTDNSTKVYNLKKWFVDDSHCKSKSSRDISSFINGF